MATVETTRLVDDLGGGDAVETVGFGLDGHRFEIDLSAANAARFREELAPFLAAARRADTPGARRARARAASGPGRARPQAEDGSPAATREQNHAVRVWARENGFTVSERGRIPAEVVDAYRRGRPAAGTRDTGPSATPEVPETPEARPAPMAVRFSG